MIIVPRQLLGFAIVAVAAAVLGGCIVPELRSQVLRLTPATHSISLRASATHAECQITARSGAHLRHDCDYVLGGTTKRARVFLQDTAVIEPLVDPVILQVPNDASGFSGIYTDGPNNGILAVTEVVGELQADLTRKIVPEPGHKLVIVDLPSPRPPLDGRQYTFGLVYALQNATTIRVKALFAAKVSFGGQTFYPPLFPCATTFSTIPALTLQESATFALVDLTPIRSANACSGSFYTFSPILSEAVPVVEFYHAGFDHYFITWIPEEIAILDAGISIKGWARTGRTFKVFTTARQGASPVCRYYIPPTHGDSHFYGRGAAECDATGANLPHLVLEAREFMYVALPVNGECPANTEIIYRVFNNRPDANHRYMNDRELRDEMARQGWVVEGDGFDRVVMCAPI